jgi:hypothetical protein
MVAAAVLAVSSANAARAGSRLIVDRQTAFAMRAVAVHNRLRAAEAVAPSLWDPALASSADTYAAKLARTGRFAHSPRATRPGQGENLWMGTRGAFSLDQMVADWASEKRYFRAGQFPNVSSTGRWEDVGHYAQIIWPTNVRVGCAVRSSARYDYLVCHYGKSGNVSGEWVGR